MTAINIALQPKHGLAHIVTDAAIYRDQGIHAFGNKIVTLPHWPGAVTSAGNAGALILIGTVLSQDFLSFDDFVARADIALPKIVRDCTRPGMSGSDIIVAGISKERGPEAYHFRTDDSLPATNTREEAEASEFWGEPCKLIKLTSVVSTPVPNDQDIPTGWEGIDVDAEPEQVVWSLRKHVTIQRHMKFPDIIGGIGGIGGFAQITTISADAITQRVLVRWPDDKVGGRLTPDPIDWKKWAVENPRPGRKEVSRLKQDMIDRKARKSALRIVT